MTARFRAKLQQATAPSAPSRDRKGAVRGIGKKPRYQGTRMRLVVAAFVLVCLGMPSISHAGQRPRVWLRRITLAASCAASAWDVQTTAGAIGRGGRESNGMFADPLGRPRWGRMVGFKVAMCGGMAAAQEWKPLTGKPVKDDLWIGINTGLAARFTIASVRNRSVGASR